MALPVMSSHSAPYQNIDHPLLTIKATVKACFLSAADHKSRKMVLFNFFALQKVFQLIFLCCKRSKSIDVVVTPPAPPGYAILTPFACSHAKEKEEGERGTEGEGEGGGRGRGKADGVAKRSGICTHIARPAGRPQRTKLTSAFAVAVGRSVGIGM